MTQFAKLAAGEQLCRSCAHRKLQHFKSFKNVSPEKSQILSCDTVVGNERYALCLQVGCLTTLSFAEVI